MNGMESYLNSLMALEIKSNGNNEALDKIDNLYRELLLKSKYNWMLLLNYNCFRIRNISRLSFFRPRILVGSMNYSHFPNFHTYDLLKIADVVSLSYSDENRIDRVKWNVFEDSIFEIISRLPDGFIPDLFFDNQIDGNHFIPLKLEQAPFATVCSLCHMAKSDVISSAAKLFDVVIPLSTEFNTFVKRNSNSHVVNLPFGANWGSFHHIINTVEKEKDIDVSITFQPTTNRRKNVYKLVHDFQNKYGTEYNIYMATDRIDKNEYFEILSRSKISINVVEIHGPYNYRTCEIINSGALLFQYGNLIPGCETRLENYFTNGEQYIEFDDFNFEDNILRLLKNPDKINEITYAAKQLLENDYSYSKIYSKMLGEISKLTIDGSGRLSEKEAEFYLAKFYWSYGDDFKSSEYGILFFRGSSEFLPSKMFMSNALALSVRCFDSFKEEDLTKVLGISFYCGKKSNFRLELINYIYNQTDKDFVARWNYLIALNSIGVFDGDIFSALRAEVNYFVDLNISTFKLVNMHLGKDCCIGYSFHYADFQEDLMVDGLNENKIECVYIKHMNIILNDIAKQL
ncbi:glycosyltransferase [Shewanella sp. A32]|uniref:glycosyltransferase n=1 Tax=Shewanella sp. A32 TaxID=3031327 RepID=UPI0023B9B6CC|nr:glycosyltransferase [Shewanella sp. A32]MDF0533971.1 glycosyltransferase [Shewanella sp. A32]